MEKQFQLLRWPKSLRVEEASGSAVVLDCDLLGVGGRWQQELREYPGEVSLACPQAVEWAQDPLYLDALRSFLAEFSPERLYLPQECLQLIEGVQAEPMTEKMWPQFKADQRSLLLECFSQTLRELGDLRQGFIQIFIQESEPRHWLLVESLREFPMHLRQRFPELPPDLAQLVYLEWSELELQFVDLGSPRPKSTKSKLSLNQSLRFLEFRNPHFHEPGLWAVYVNEALEVKKHSLVSKEALAIDLIREDRAFGPDELAHLLSIYDPLVPMSAREARGIIEKLCAEEIFYLS